MAQYQYQPFSAPVAVPPSVTVVPSQAPYMQPALSIRQATEYVQPPTQPQAAVVAVGSMQAAQVRAGRVTQYQARAGVSGLFEAAGVPELSWLSQYADAVSRQPSVGGDSTVEPFTQAFVTATTFFQAEFPDLIQAIRQVVGDASVGPFEQVVIPTLLAWQAEYADRVGAVLRVQGGEYSRADVQTSIPTFWQPEFVDLIRQTPRLVEGAYVRADVQTSVPTLLAWLAEFVDAVRYISRTNGDVAAQTFIQAVTQLPSVYVQTVMPMQLLRIDPTVGYGEQ